MDAKGDNGWRAIGRQGKVFLALVAYGMLASCADKGAVRDSSKTRKYLFELKNSLVIKNT
jgi:hypothetical protein